MSTCRFGLCNGDGWREVGGRTVEPCPCRSSAEVCLMPQCGRPASVAASMCEEHWRAVPARVRDRLRRAERAWQRGRASTEEFEQAKRAAVEAARQEVMHL